MEPARPPSGKSRVLRRGWSFAASGTGIRIEVALLVAAAVAAIVLFPRLRALERSALADMSEMGYLAPIFLIAAYSAVAALQLPAFPLDFAAGAHFGFWQGALWVQLAATLAAATGYVSGQFLLGRLVNHLRNKKPELRRIETAVAEEGGKIVLLTRLSPIFPFSLLNSFYGALRTPFRPYLLSSFLGMIPGTALYVYAGMMAGDLSGAPGRPQRSPWEWGLMIAGFVATLVLVVIFTRRAQRILGHKIRAPREA